MNSSDQLPPHSRCPWAGNDHLMIDYHDREWGTPLHDDLKLFELLNLEGAQAGLSWSTILRKREAYREAFSGFDPTVVSAFDDTDVARLIANSGIVRNRLKIQAVITNARAHLRLVDELGSFDRYLWAFVDGAPRDSHLAPDDPIPAKTDESERMSAALRRRGFTFVGPTICYAFIQSSGMVNDHLTTCFRHAELTR